jgi:aldehyde:ferredoxin oxidoreductase
MKKAGFWAIDIKGIADSPLYIKINNQEVEFIDAAHLWGMETGETQQAVLGGLSPEKGAAAVIGPAGERLLPCAIIITGGAHYRNFGRGGAGSVMGSKRIKAIAISGDGAVEAADKDKFEAVRRVMTAIAREKKEALADWRNHGTVGWSLELMGKTGILPTRNWQQGHFEGWRGIDPRVREGEWPKKNHACAPFCLSTCAQYMEIDKGDYKGFRGNRPEYETVYAFGSQCGIDKYDAIVAANQICSESGIDTISSGVTIGFAMECFERGLIGLQDTDGIELRFGNDRAMIAMLKKIISQDGFGCQLAKGVRRLSQEIKGSEASAMHAKGLELCGYECRGLNGQALEYAINNRGGDHSAYGFPTYAELADGSRTNIEGKGEQVKRLAIGRITRDSLSVAGRWQPDKYRG